MHILTFLTLVSTTIYNEQIYKKSQKEHDQLYNDSCCNKNEESWNTEISHNSPSNSLIYFQKQKPQNFIALSDKSKRFLNNKNENVDIPSLEHNLNDVFYAETFKRTEKEHKKCTANIMGCNSYQTCNSNAPSFDPTGPYFENDHDFFTDEDNYELQELTGKTIVKNDEITGAYITDNLSVQNASTYVKIFENKQDEKTNGELLPEMYEPLLKELCLSKKHISLSENTEKLDSRKSENNMEDVLNDCPQKNNGIEDILLDNNSTLPDLTTIYNIEMNTKSVDKNYMYVNQTISKNNLQNSQSIILENVDNCKTNKIYLPIQLETVQSQDITKGKSIIKPIFNNLKGPLLDRFFNPINKVQNKSSYIANPKHMQSEQNEDLMPINAFEMCNNESELKVSRNHEIHKSKPVKRAFEYFISDKLIIPHVKTKKMRSHENLSKRLKKTKIMSFCTLLSHLKYDLSNFEENLTKLMGYLENNLDKIFPENVFKKDKDKMLNNSINSNLERGCKLFENAFYEKNVDKSIQYLCPRRETILLMLILPEIECFLQKLKEFAYVESDSTGEDIVYKAKSYLAKNICKYFKMIRKKSISIIHKLINSKTLFCKIATKYAFPRKEMKLYYMPIIEINEIRMVISKTLSLFCDVRLTHLYNKTITKDTKEFNRYYNTQNRLAFILLFMPQNEILTRIMNYENQYMKKWPQFDDPSTCKILNKLINENDFFCNLCERFQKYLSANMLSIDLNKTERAFLLEITIFKWVFNSYYIFEILGHEDTYKITGVSFANLILYGNLMHLNDLMNQLK